MNVVVADEHQIVRKGVHHVLSSQGAWRVVGEAGTASELFDVLSRNRVDVLVIDPYLPDCPALEVIAELRRRRPALAILVLSPLDDDVFAVALIRAGVRACIAKSSSASEIFRAVERVARGEVVISESATQLLTEQLLSGNEAVAPHERLSPRELDVFRRIARGETVTSIARDLGVSVKTVSTYRTRILQKTGFRSNAEIVAYSVRLRLV